MKIDQITEGWSKKYKRSIDCNNPKGFSQRAHCDGRKKTNEDIGNLPDWETIVALAVAAKMTPMAIKAMWRTAKGAYKLKKFADRAGIKLADKLVGENDRQELPVNMDRIRDLIQRLESRNYLTPEEADDMRRAVQALASGRDTILPHRILQLLNMVS
jgi:hypothetical protein